LYLTFKNGDVRRLNTVHCSVAMRQPIQTSLTKRSWRGESRSSTCCHRNISHLSFVSRFTYHFVTTVERQFATPRVHV